MPRHDGNIFLFLNGKIQDWISPKLLIQPRGLADGLFFLVKSEAYVLSKEPCCGSNLKKNVIIVLSTHILGKVFDHISSVVFAQ